MFLIGLLVGVGISAVIFMLLNLEKPDAVDRAEEDVRNLKPEYEEVKAKVKKSVRRKKNDAV